VSEITRRAPGERPDGEGGEGGVVTPKRPFRELRRLQGAPRRCCWITLRSTVKTFWLSNPLAAVTKPLHNRYKKEKTRHDDELGEAIAVHTNVLRAGPVRTQGSRDPRATAKNQPGPGSMPY